jgi:hypothetical protein
MSISKNTFLDNKKSGQLSCQQYHDSSSHWRSRYVLEQQVMEQQVLEQQVLEQQR